MTPGGASRRRGRLRTWLPWLLIALGVLALGALRPRGDPGIPLDPASPAPAGTKGLVDVLQELGSAEVAGAPGEADTALLLRDRLDDRSREELLGWVEGGGLLMVADPSSTLTDLTPTGSATGGFLNVNLPRQCDVPALAGAQEVNPPDPILFTVPEGATGCFRDGDGAWLVLQPRGFGTVVRLGGAAALTNQWLDDADNAVVAASLLVPTPDTRTVILDPQPAAGDQTLADLIHPRVTSALFQLTVAFVVLAAWRGRRLGRPVTEPQPVRLAASELVVAVGNLLQRSRRRDHAARLLAADLRRTLCERLGLPVSMRDEDIAGAAAARTGVPRDQILAALTARQVTGEADLVTLAHTVESIRHEVLHSQ